MESNTVTKKYVSALTLANSAGSIDFRQIYRKVLNVTNEEFSFLDVLELQNKKERTDSPYYHSGANVEIRQIETINSVPTVVTASPQGVISFDILNTSGNEKIRIGDIVMFASQYTGLVTNKTVASNVVTLTVKAVVSTVTAANLAAANTQKIAVITNASGEGSGSRENLRWGLTTKYNQVTKFKDNYTISDVEKANRIEFEYNGQPRYINKTEMEALMNFRGQISFGLLFEEMSAPNWQASSPTLVDSAGNPIQTTKGLRQYCKTEGINLTGVTINATHYATLARQFAAARTPSEFQIYQGVEGAIAHDNYASTIAANLLSTQAQLMVDGKEISLGLKKIEQYGYTYTLMRMPMLDHKGVTNFTGGAGLHKEIYYIPAGKIKTVDGTLVDRIRCRYMPMEDGGMIFETEHGRLSPNRNGEEDVFKKVYSANMGLEIFGAEHFALIALS